MNHLSPGTSSPLALNQSQPSIEQQETMSRILNDLSASLQPRYSASRQSIKPQQYAKRRKAVFNPHDHDRTHHIQCCDKPCPLLAILWKTAMRMLTVAAPYTLITDCIDPRSCFLEFTQHLIFEVGWTK